VITILEQKLAHAHGLAIAASVVAEKVSAHVADSAFRRELETMHAEARETRARCLRIEELLGGEKANELLAHANSMSERASDLAGAWFKAGTSPLEAVAFLAMGEAGEVATWLGLAQLVRDGADPELVDLAEWALPVQERHLAVALDAAAALGRAADPAGPRWG
jgi:hypothetical protein